MQTLRTPSRRLLPAKWIFFSALLIITATILTVYLTGFTSSRTILENATVSLTVLSVTCFAFLTMCLYKGVKLKDDVGDLTKKIKWRKDTPLDVPDASSTSDKGSILPDLDVGDGADEFAAAVFFWIATTLAIIVFLFLFETVIWAFVLLLAAMLYWVFFRAVRLVLKHSAKCKGKLAQATLYGFGYTLLYSSWIYAVLLTVKFLR